LDHTDSTHFSLIAPNPVTMAGRQRTFELIPTTLAAKSHGNQPTYMTSKQVKKAYQQANRGPRISRAEQRRLDAEELERQNKEYERERAAAKAKAAREKKAAKEAADKEARRKMGLPEPSRFVRASQPTISKFVRGGNNGKRSWQEMKMHTLEEDSDGTLPESGFGEKDDAQPPAKRVPAQDDSEDEFGDFPSLSQSDLLEKIDSSMVSFNGGGTGSPAVVAEQPALPPCQEPSQSLPAREYSEDEYPLVESQLIPEMVNTQLLSEAAEAVQKSDGTELPVPKQTTPKPTLSKQPQQQVQPIPKDILPETTHAKIQKLSVSRSADSNNTRTKPAKPTVVSRPVLQEVSTNMPPPPIPLKEKKAISFAPSPQKHRSLLQITTKTTNKPKHIIPLSGTQVFLENHLDDFFPSPTQEIRELLSDVDDLPSNTQIARDLSPDSPKEDLNSLPPNRATMRWSNPNSIIEENEFDNLICTQDLVLSSQELLEITTPSRPPPKSQKQKPVPRPKPRFFEEKDDDILHAVLHESKTNAARSHGPAPQARETKRPFFEEKDDDLLAAAIHESKVMAEKRRMVKVPLKETNENERKERTLKRRISSASTDYGEDEFSGEEWDSLGL
jgi:hypothetical protein